jgi:hydrogenase expression/formation protein HypC
MCIAVPMQVVVPGPFQAVCEAGGRSVTVDMALVGEQPAGTWLLVFLGAAREVIPAERAAEIANALQALDLAMGGVADLDHLFADLADREPELPPHLVGQG